MIGPSTCPCLPAIPHQLHARPPATHFQATQPNLPVDHHSHTVDLKMNHRMPLHKCSPLFMSPCLPMPNMPNKSKMHLLSVPL